MGKVSSFKKRHKQHSHELSPFSPTAVSCFTESTLQVVIPSFIFCMNTVLPRVLTMSLIVSRLTMILMPIFTLSLSHTNVRAHQSFLDLAIAPPFFPPAIPLALRSPYLKSWLQSTPSPKTVTTFNSNQVCLPFAGILSRRWSSQLSRLSEPRVVCPRTSRWSDLFALGECISERP